MTCSDRRELGREQPGRLGVGRVFAADAAPTRRRLTSSVAQRPGAGGSVSAGRPAAAAATTTATTAATAAERAESADGAGRGDGHRQRLAGDATVGQATGTHSHLSRLRQTLRQRGKSEETSGRPPRNGAHHLGATHVALLHLPGRFPSRDR